MKKEVFDIFMNVIHPDMRYNEETIEYYFDQIFHAKLNKKQWEEWKERNKE